MRNFVIACAAVFSASSAPVLAEVKVGQHPEPGIEASVTIGSPMYERFNMDVVSVPRLERPVNVSLGLQGKIAVPASALFTIDSTNPLRVCTLAKDTYIDNFVGPRGAACLTDTDMNGDFDKAAGAKVMFTSKKIDPPVPYRIAEVASGNGDSMKEVLIFTGAAGGALHLSYRQFADDMARPAFTEDLAFPMEATFPQNIIWRDTRFILLSFNGGILRYRVEAAR